MNKYILIVLLLLVVLLFVPFASSSDIHIYTKKIDHSVLPQKYTIEVYASLRNLDEHNGTLICSVYSISEQIFTKKGNIKINKAINITTISMKDKNIFSEPICKISQDGYDKAFYVHGYVTNISRNRGTIIDTDGLPEYAEYKYLLINVTIITDSGKVISNQQLLHSGYKEIKNNREDVVTHSQVSYPYHNFFLY